MEKISGIMLFALTYLALVAVVRSGRSLTFHLTAELQPHLTYNTAITIRDGHQENLMCTGWYPVWGECLFAHNKVRRQHEGTPDISWEQGLADNAAMYARTLATMNQHSASSSYSIEHSKVAGVTYGENTYAGTAGSFSERSIAHAMHFWYREGINYPYWNPSPRRSTGHFTQVVWRSTTAVGCGKAAYMKDMAVHTIIVCQYKPKGNVSMKYTLNVLPLKAGGKDSFSFEELTGEEQIPTNQCSYKDNIPQACVGMKKYCNDKSNTHLMGFLQQRCKKTCYC